VIKIRQMHSDDQNSWSLLWHIAKLAQNTSIDHRKFATMRQGVTKFSETKNMLMNAHELFEYCKTFFEDRKFIDMVVKFTTQATIEPKPESADETAFVANDRLQLLQEVMENLSLISSRDKNLSSDMGMAIAQTGLNTHKQL